MNTEEEIRAAIVVYPEGMVYISPELNHATELLCEQLEKLMDYLQTLDPELEKHEVTLLGAAILESLPESLEKDPVTTARIKSECQAMRTNR